MNKQSHLLRLTTLSQDGGNHDHTFTTATNSQFPQEKTFEAREHMKKKGIA